MKKREKKTRVLKEINENKKLNTVQWTNGIECASIFVLQLFLQSMNVRRKLNGCEMVTVISTFFFGQLIRFIYSCEFVHSFSFWNIPYASAGSGQTKFIQLEE